MFSGTEKKNNNKKYYNNKTRGCKKQHVVPLTNNNMCIAGNLYRWWGGEGEWLFRSCIVRTYKTIRKIHRMEFFLFFFFFHASANRAIRK